MNFFHEDPRVHVGGCKKQKKCKQSLQNTQYYVRIRVRLIRVFLAHFLSFLQQRIKCICSFSFSYYSTSLIFLFTSFPSTVLHIIFYLLIFTFASFICFFFILFFFLEFSPGCSLHLVRNSSPNPSLPVSSL